MRGIAPSILLFYFIVKMLKVMKRSEYSIRNFHGRKKGTTRFQKKETNHREGKIRFISWQVAGQMCLILEDGSEFRVPTRLLNYQNLFETALAALACNQFVRIGFYEESVFQVTCLQVLSKL